ncbi:hypothetical protein [Melissospora conviva]|uniref:hypothetical protein n=1 Tax=Melissospora conviva TaxID=3388432 RepID=UPI003B7EA122
MNTAVRLTAYGLGLVAVFAATLGLGRLAGPQEPVAPHDTHSATEPGTAVAVPGGLQVAEQGYRVAPLSAGLSTTGPGEFRFRILGPDGAPVTDYTENHDKDLHLILVRRDLTGYRHLHPDRAADGTWSVPVAVDAPGSYRVFADFRPAALDRGLTLGVDVPAPGDYQPRALPAPARTATVDGYTVTLAGDLTSGESSKLTAQVSRDGRPVTDLQPYLGAYGHLVALRAGDLAYLHVHPDGEPGDGRTAAGPEVAFHVEVPSDGAYRLYLDFRHGGEVRTAEFTITAGATPASVPSSAGSPSVSPSPSEHGEPGHGHG